MYWANASYLWWELLIIPMILVVVFYWIWKRRKTEAIGDASLVKLMSESRSSRRQIGSQVCMILAVILLVIAGAQPQWGTRNRPIKRTGIDIVFAMDLSKSMLAKDVGIPRMEAAKNEIRETMTQLAGDRVGLVVFTAISFQQSPLTSDYGAIRFYLSKLSPTQMPIGGTSIGSAILDSVELLTGESNDPANQNDGSEQKRQRAKNQIVVVITDGEDHESDPLAAAQAAKDKNVKIVTVGFGSPAGDKIPEYRANGKFAGYKRDKAGNPILTRLDEKTLNALSDKTGGTYIKYNGEGSVAAGLIDYVKGLERSELESLLKARYKERFFFFIAPAIFFALLSLLLGDRRRRWYLPTFMAIVFGLSGCDRPFESQLSDVVDGNTAVAAGEFDKALAFYQEAETEVPARADLHYNLGIAHAGLNDVEQAQAMFGRALNSDDATLQFDAYFNLGSALATNEDWEGAFESFEDALVVAYRHPGTVSDARLEDAAWNMELMYRKLFPPCAQLEDDQEDNDTVADSKPVASASASGTPSGPAPDKEGGGPMSLCGADDDWVKIPAIPGTQVSITASFKDLREKPDPDAAFITTPEDVQLALFNQTGDNVAAIDQGANDDIEAIRKSRKFKRTIEDFMVTEEMVDPENPFIHVRLSAIDILEFEYTLEIVSIPPCIALEEASEENDSASDAAVIPGGEHKMHICPNDEDWFAIKVAAGDSVFADIIPGQDLQREIPPEISVDFFDASTRRMIAEGVVDGNFITAGIKNLTTDGTVLVRISGNDNDQQGPYDLNIYQYAQCPSSDDRFEENDDVANAGALTAQKPVERYLRQCPGDPDYFKIAFPKDEKYDPQPATPTPPATNQPDDKDANRVSMGLSLPIVGSEIVDDVFIPEFTFDHMSATGDSIVTAGLAPVAAAPPEQTRFHRVIASEPVEADSAIIRVAGGYGFYHLEQLNPQDSDQEKQEEEEKKDESEEKEKGDDEEEKENEPDDGDEGDDDKEGENEDENAENENDETEPTEETQEEKVAQGEEKESPEDEKRNDILNALEESDDNFQMRKALEKAPNRYIEKDW